MARREDGTTNTYVVRYPDGSSEFRMSTSLPQVGDIADVADARGTLRVLLRRAAATS
jgi:predicted ester cyclase